MERLGGDVVHRLITHPEEDLPQRAVTIDRHTDHLAEVITHIHLTIPIRLRGQQLQTIYPIKGKAEHRPVRHRPKDEPPPIILTQQVWGEPYGAHIIRCRKGVVAQRDHHPVRDGGKELPEELGVGQGILAKGEDLRLRLRHTEPLTKTLQPLQVRQAIKLPQDRQHLPKQILLVITQLLLKYGE